LADSQNFKGFRGLYCYAVLAALLILSGVMGIWKSRMPVASNIALAIAPPTATIGGSPPP
jgi:hypothetical protein